MYSSARSDLNDYVYNSQTQTIDKDAWLPQYIHNGMYVNQWLHKHSTLVTVVKISQHHYSNSPYEYDGGDCC